MGTEYTATIVLDRNYQGSLSFNYTIRKATPVESMFNIPEVGSVGYSGGPVVVPAPTLKSPMTGCGKITVTYAGELEPPTSPGRYYVTFDVEGGDNFRSRIRLEIGYLEITSYTVHFDGNGAEGVMGDGRYIAGPYTLPECDFVVPEGKVFSKWAAGSTEGVQYDPGYEYNVLSDITFYAIWEDIIYHITFDSNGGTGSMQTVEKTYGEIYELPENGFTAPEGMTFYCWMVGVSEKLVGYKQTVNSDLVIKPVWWFDLSFDANGGTGEMSIQVFKYNVSANLRTNTFTWAHHQFMGWATSADGDVVYEDGQNVTFIQGITSLYAVWDEDPKYTVTFNSNGGSSVLPYQDVYVGSKISAPEVPTYTHYDFVGWFKDAGLTDDWNFSVDTVNSNITLYAKWQSVPTYNVIFNSNGGIGSMENIIVYRGYPADLPKNTFTKEHYHFMGWAVTSDGAVVYDDQGSVTLDRETNLYAKWEEDPKYRATFDLNGGSVDSTPAGWTPSGGNYIKDFYVGTIKSEIIADFGDYSKVGYAKQAEITSVSVMGSEGMLITAQWNVNKYTVQLANVDPFENGPTGWARHEVYYRSFDYGTPISEIIASIAYNSEPVVPTRTGYTFTEWSPNTGTLGAETLILTAVYSINIHTVALDLDGGELANTPTGWALGTGYTKDFQFDTAYSAIIASIVYDSESIVPTKTGYTFAGWSPNSGKLGDADATLTANWTPQTFDISITNNDDLALSVKIGDADARAVTDEELAAGKIASVAYDTVVRFTASPIDGYDLFYQVTAPVAGAKTALGEGYQFTVEGASTIAFTKEIQTFDVSFTRADGITLSVKIGDADARAVTSEEIAAGKIESIEYGTAVRFTASSITGYDLFYQVTAPVAGAKTAFGEGYQFTVEGASTIAFTKEKQRFTVSIGSDTGISEVEYSLNGGAPVTYTGAFQVEYEDTLVLTATLVAGHDFVRWADGLTDNPYTIDSVEANVTLSAVSAIRTFTVALTPGTGYVITEQSGSLSPVNYGGSFSFTVAYATGYEGNLVVKANDETITAVAGVYTISNITEDKTVTVTGAQLRQLTVTFHRNGGTSGEMSDQTVYYGTPANLTLNTFSYYGHIFTRWNTNYRGTGTAYADGAEITITEDVTLYAIWAPKELTITLNPDGGTVSPASLHLTYNTDYVLPIPTYPGHNFAGWYIHSTPVQKISNSGKWTLRENDITLFAHWTELPVHSMTFLGGAGSEGSMSAIPVIQGEDFTLPDCTITKAGYHFHKWSCNAVEYDAGYTFENVTGPMEFLVVWEGNMHTVTVHYVYLGGTPVRDDIVQEHRFGTDYAIYSDVLTGYTADKTVVSGTMPDADVTETVTYTANQHTITFDCAGGEAIAPMVKGYGDAILAPIAVRAGYDFAGWSPALPATMPDNDLTVVAKWTSKPVASDGNEIAFVSDGDSAVIDTGSSSVVDALNDATKTTVAVSGDGWAMDIPKEIIAGATGSVSVSAQTLSDSEKAALPESVKERIAGKTVYSLDLSDTSGKITFTGKKIKVSLPYVLASGENASNVKVFCISGEDLIQYDATYDSDKKVAVFETDHFSDWFVDVVESSSGNSNGGGFPIWIAIVIVVVIAAAGAGAFFFIKNKKA